MKKANSKGFTLIELLIVIAIVAVIAGATFVALDPLTRFRDSRDARRWSDVSTILSAIKVDQVDNRGSYLAAIDTAATGTVYMISSSQSGSGTGCSATCAGGNTTACINLNGLVSNGKLGVLPVSPKSSGDWGAEDITGYSLKILDSGAITISACEGENGLISVTR
ncbi:MAG: hypothetical protein BWY51_00639 [Parcubacteria group bacterium ADurb.Bin316]|nr:MAG: hypothetical protein BWY51_00639 [Parcubacteria group bacterium ADurb.Bin316]HOZ55831.1 prepilin-type N-terminal cleavage/methylation domain-containing protein [bacterium]